MKAAREETSSLRRKALAVAVVSCFAGYAQANPTNPAVMSGAATFAASGKNLNITNTPGAIINWQGFSIKADEVTRFIQQNAQSAVLNRVTGQEQSAILGQLLSNGRVYLINPNGITIGAGARVDTAGFVASSLNLSDSDALAGRFKLQDTGSSGKVVNNGTITTASGGFVYLVAPNIENNGIITSPKGEIILAAGKTVELVDSQKPELRVLLTAPENTAINVGKMIAEAGSIGIFAGAIKQSGLISANSAVVGENGKIILRAKKDITLEAGSKTEASGPQGGSISIQSEAGTTLVAGIVEARATSTPTVYQLKDPAPAAVATDLSPNPDVVPVKVDLKASNTITMAGKGGSVAILGDLVGLTDHASVDVSGESGGGQILVGGDYQGKNPTVQNAQRTFVGKDVQLVADAILKGDGGKVIVWADNDTYFVGSIWARGGKDGGNGGFAEVSGKAALNFQGRADLRAPRGEVGTLLLDPDDITIIAGGATTADTLFDASGRGAGPFTDSNSSATASTISDATINGQLASAAVTIKTTQSGSITDQAAVVVTLTNPLTLQSAAGITLTGSYTGTSTLNLNFATILDLSSAQPFTGATVIATGADAVATANSTIKAAGGTWNLTGANAGNLGTLGVSFAQVGNLQDTSAGNFKMHTTGDGSLTGGITAVGGKLDYTGYTTSPTFDLAAGTNTTTGIAGTWSGITTVTGRVASDGTITGSGATYNLSGADAGTSGTVSWTKFGNVTDTGTGGVVNMHSTTDGRLSGNLVLPSGTLDYTGYGSAPTFELTGAGNKTTGITGTWSGITTVTGRGGSADGTIQGNAQTYNLTAADAGNNSTVSWTKFGNTTDTGTGGVVKMHSTTDGSLSGNLALPGGTLDYTGYGSAPTFDLGGGASTGIGGWTGITTVTGRAAADGTIKGSGAIYNLTGADQGNTGPVSWTNFGNITDTGSGGTVNLHTGGGDGSLSGNLVLPGGTLNYTGFLTAPTFDLLGANTGSTSGIAGTWSGVTAVTGRAASDGTIKGSGATYNLTSLDAGNNSTVFWTGFNTLTDIGGGTLTGTGQTWNLTGVGQGTVALLSGGFSGVRNLQDFGAGVFKFHPTATDGSVTGSISASAGTLDYTGYSTPATVDLTATTASGVGSTWTGITSITGSSNSDTVSGSGATYRLTSANAGNSGGVFWTSFEKIVDTGTGTLSTTGGQTYNLTGSNAGDVSTLLPGGFTGIANITDTDAGGATVIRFTTDTAAVTGNVAAVGGTLDYSAGITGPITFELGGAANKTKGIGGTWSGIAGVIGTGAGDTIKGTNQTYNLSNPDAGDNGIVSWTGFANLTDSGAGNFKLAAAASVSGSITAAGGTLDYGARATRVDVTVTDTTLGTGSGTDVPAFTGIAQVTGSSNAGNTLTGPATSVWTIASSANTGTVDNSGGGSGGAAVGFTSFPNLIGSGTDTLVGPNTGATFNITGSDAGSVTGLIASFTGMQNLKGGTGDDTFTVAASGSISGTITGGGAASQDTLSYSGFGAGVVSVTLVDTSLGSGSGTAVNGFTGIHNLVGNANATLTGPDLKSTAWGIVSADGGFLNDSGGGTGGAAVSFSSFKNLHGGSGDEIFTLGASGSISGAITGGGGADTLVGPNTSSTFNITGADSGSVSGFVASFTGIKNLTGGTADDFFVLGPSGSLSGTITGGGSSPLGFDTLDLSARSGALSVTVTDTTAGTGSVATAVVNAFAGINWLTGNATTTLIGPAVPSTWTISSIDGGTLCNGCGGSGGVKSVGFGSIQNLTSGAGGDTFKITTGSLSGTISGVTGSALDYSNYGSDVTIGLTGPNSGTATGIGGGFSGVSTIDANAANSNTMGGSGQTYNLTSANSGDNGALSWTAFGNLTDTGTTGTFTGAGGSISGALTATVGATLNGTLNVGSATLGPVTLGADTTLASTSSGTLTITGAIAGAAHSLDLNTGGTTQLQGGASGLSTLTTDATGTTEIRGTITSTGAQTYNDAVLLTAAATTNAGAGLVRFASTVDGAQTLSIPGAGGARFDAAVGTTALTGVSVTGASAINGGSVRTTGDQTYTGAVALGANTTLASTGSGTITVSGAITGATHSLDVNTGGTDKIQGGASGLSTLTTDATGTTDIQGTITSAGAQTYNDAVLLKAATTTDAGAGLVRFASTLDGAQTLSIPGAGGARFDAAVGTTALTSMSVTGASAINGGSVRTTGDQTYAGAVTLGANTTLASTSSGAMTVAGAITGGGFSLDVNTGGTDKIQGGASGLSTLTTDATGATEIQGAITSTGAQTYNDAVLLKAATTTDAGVGLVHFASTLDGAQTLSIAGAGGARFDAAVGTTALTSVSVTGASAINGGSVTTTGLQTYTGAVTLGANTTLASTGSGTIRVAGAITGATHSLDLNTGGTTQLQGGASGLTTLTTDATGTTQIRGTITSTGAQTYNDAVVLTAATTTVGGDITFQNTLDASTAVPNAEALTLNAGSAGNILFTGAVGGGARLGAITITNANDVTESAGITAASLVQTAGQGTTLLSGPVNANTITGVQITANNITLGSGGGITTTAPSVGVVSLTYSGALMIAAPINADGDVTVNGSSGLTTLNADIVTTSDLVQFSQPVLLTGNRSIDTTAADPNGDGGTIRFLGTVNGGGNSLSLAAPPASGDIAFSQAASNLSALTVTSGRNFSTAATAPIAVGSGGISVTVGGTTTINSTITTSGSGGVIFANGGLLTLNGDIAADGQVAQTGAGLVTINTDRTITTTADAVSFATDVRLNKTSGTGLLTIDTTSGNAAGNNITFSGKLDGSTAGSEPLTLNAGSAGNVLLTGAVGGVTRLGAINITNANDVTESAGITAASLAQAAGQGTSKFDGTVNTNSAAGISITNVGGISITANVSNSAGGNITLTTTGAPGDISIAANKSVTSSGGNGVMTLDAGRTITLGAGATVRTGSGGAGTGTVSFNAGQAAAGNISLAGDSLVQSDTGAIGLNANGGGTSSISMADVATTNSARILSTSGAVTLFASKDVALGAVNTGSAVGVTAANGSISDNTPGETIANITGTSVTLSAVGGAIGGTGTGADIDTSITSVKAAAGGNVVLRQLSGGGNLAIGVSGGGISSSGGDIVVRVDAGSLNINQNVSTTGAGNVAVKAAGGASDININGATVSSTTGNLQAIAGRHILTNTTTGTTNEFATSGTLLLDAQDSIGNTTKRIDTAVGTLAAVSSGGSAAGDIFLNQTAGALTIGTTTGLDGRSNLNGITTAANNNDITLVSAGSVTVTQNVTANGSGNVALKTTGANDVNINGASVSSTTGNLQVVSGRHILTNTTTGTTNEFATGGAGTLLLDAQDSIGTTANRIDTIVPTVAAISTGVSTSGDIFLNQTAGGLAIGTAAGLDGRASLAGIATIANNNDITLASSGAVTVTQNMTAHGSGNVALKTTGANDLNINGATVSSTSGNLQVVSGRHILTSTATGTTNEFATGGAGTLLLDAQDSIGSTANRIDTAVPTVATISAGVSTAGDIFLNQTAGALTIGTATGLDGRANLAGTTSANNNDITVVSRAGAITVAGPISVNGDALLQALGTGSDITVSNNITSTSATSGKTVALQADRNIVFNSSASILTSNALNVVLNSDYSDGNGAGAIRLNSGTLINSNGGNITLGGGAAPSTTPAIGQGVLAEGILINGAQLQSGTGNIILSGTGLAGASGGYGIRIANSGVVQSVSGSITMTGLGGAGANNDGVLLNASSSILSSAGAIQVKGTRTGSGVDINTTGGGNIIGGATSSGSSSDILLEAAGTSGISTDAVIATSGSTTLNASAGGAITQTGGSILATGGANSALRILGDTAQVTSTIANLSSPANDINVLVVSLPGATSTLSYRDANGFTIGSLAKPIDQVGPGVSHDGIIVGTPNGANNTLTLNAFGAVTQTQPLTVGALQLLGGGGVTYTLIQAANDISTLAASTSGPISYRDANSYAVGTVSSLNRFSVGAIPTGSATNGTAETGTPGSFTATSVGIHTTAGGALQLDVPGTLTINNDISADGAIAQISTAGTGTVSIASARAISTTGDAVSFASPVTLTGGNSTTIDTTTGTSPAGANVTFGNTLTGTTASAENLTINAGSGGGVTFDSTVGTTRLGDVTISRARDVTIQAGYSAKTLTQSQGATGVPAATPSAGATTINAAVDTTGNTSLATSGALVVSGAGSITAGAGSTVALTSGSDMTLSGNVTAPAGATINVTGTDRVLTQNGGIIASANSAVALIADEMILSSAISSGSGAVTLKPNNKADAILLGAATAAANFAAATLELSNDELNRITTTGGLTVGAADNTGAINVAGALTPITAQNGFTLQNNSGGIAINAPVTYAAGSGNLTLTANGAGAAAGAITTNGSVLDVAGTLSMNAATGIGTLASPMVLSHAAGTTLTVTNTTRGGVFERADSGDLNLISVSNNAAASGGINLNVGTNLNINGTVQNTIGDIQLVTGNDAAYAGAGGFGLSPASVATGTLGGVNINGQVIANNGGGIAIFSTGPVNQSTGVAAGLQSIPVTGSFVRGPLKVRTFNNGAQVGVIDLENNLAGSGNSMGPITLETRLAGSTTPPPYAQSNIEYRSINGTSISGIGTAADFSLVAPSQTIDLAPGSSLSGANISLIATAGDVTVNSAITNAQINGGETGGSLNLYATGNIVLNNPGGSSSGVVIGRDLGTLDPQGNRQFEKFDHTLKLVATGDVRIHGTVEVKGDLALRANASASEASGPGGVAGFGAGSGSVIIAGSAGNPVEVRAKNIIVGVKDAGDNPLSVQNLIIDNSANSAGTGKFFDSVLRAEEKLDVYLNGDQGGPATSGNIVVTGGTASAVSANNVAKSSALAAIRGDIVTILGVTGGTSATQSIKSVNPLAPYATNSSNITLTGGTASSNTVAGGGALAASDALILGTTSKFIDIGGNLVLTGGTADSKNGGQTSAAAKIDPVSMTINTGGYIKLIGGTGGGALAGIVASGDMEINIGGKFDYTFTDASGTHTVPNVGLLMVGGIGSGIFDRNNLPLTLIGDVSSQVRVLFPAINGGPGGGTYFLRTDATKATAFIQSLSPRGFDDSLLSYIIFAANEETRTGRIRTGISNTDDSGKPSCN